MKNYVIEVSIPSSTQYTQEPEYSDSAMEMKMHGLIKTVYYVTKIIASK